MNSQNPLAQYFRQPVIYVSLPSKGRFYPPNTLETNSTGELPVYPMTAIDEVTYRTPDALFNGQAVVNVIQSCIPGIKDAWFVPAMDVDYILIAIRIASYGHEMEFASTCPNCKETADHSVDLRTALENIGAPDYSSSLRHGDIEVFFKPMNYRNMTDSNRAQFDHNMRMRSIDLESDNEETALERTAQLSAAMLSLTEMTVKAMTQNIASIKTPNALVSESNFIEEFLRNCDRKFFEQIQERVFTLRSASEIKPLNMKCDSCGYEYIQPITLDMANFFGNAS